MADIIVDGSAGGGPGARNTITAGIGDAADGDTIFVKDTTGGICTAGVWNEYILYGNTGNCNVTIKPHSSNTNPIILKPATTGYACLRAANTDTGPAGRYTWEDITFDHSLAAYSLCIRLDSTKATTFTRCAFVPGTDTTTVISAAATGNTTRNITLTDCTYTSSGTTDDFFIHMNDGSLTMSGCVINRSAGKVAGLSITCDEILGPISITGGSITHGSTSTGELIRFNPSVAASTIIIDGVIFSSGIAECIKCTYSATGTLPNLLVQNCNFSASGTLVTYSLGISMVCPSTMNRFYNNTFTSLYQSISYGQTRSCLPDYIDIRNNNITVAVGETTISSPIRCGIFSNLSHYGTLAADAASSTTQVIVCDASLVNDYWNGAVFEVLTGTAAGEIKKVVDYAATTKTITVDTAFTIEPDSGDTYRIYFPAVTKMVYVIGNRVIINSPTSTYGIQIDRGIKFAEVADNYVYQATQEHAITIKADNSWVHNNISIGASPCYIQGSGSHLVEHNTFYSTKHGALEWSTAVNYTDYTPMGTLTSRNNILVAKGSDAFCMFDFGSSLNLVNSDYNCFWYENSGAAMRVNDNNSGGKTAATISTLALLQAEWLNPNAANWVSTSPWLYNDAHSINVNPNFGNISNLASGNFTPHNTQVMKGGRPDAAGNATTMGAIMTQGSIKGGMFGGSMFGD